MKRREPKPVYAKFEVVEQQRIRPRPWWRRIYFDKTVLLIAGGMAALALIRGLNLH